MAQVYVKRDDKLTDEENIDEALKLFNKKVHDEHILQIAREHEYYLSPSQKKKRKREKAQKRARKKYYKHRHGDEF